MDVRFDPRRQLHILEGLGVGVVAGAQRRDKQIRRASLPGLRIDQRHRQPGPVDKQAFPGRMELAHGRFELIAEAAIVFPELGVAIARRMVPVIFLPQQLERHALALELPVHLGHRRQIPLWFPEGFGGRL